MLDNALINLLATSLEAASAAFEWNYIVVQKDEPTQQGIPTDPTIFFEKLFDTSRHFPMETYSVNALDATKLDDTEVQLVETVFQVSALVIQDPNNLSLPTASDVVNALRGFLISRNNADFRLRRLEIHTFKMIEIGMRHFLVSTYRLRIAAQI
jgi:hypothetical protein